MTAPDSLNVLLIGGGGREHALAEAISRSTKLGKLWVTHPQNPALARLGTPVDVPVDIKQIYRLQQFCDREKIGFVIIGPEDPLAEGYADHLSKTLEGFPRPVFGPSAAAARLEADKIFSKQLMRAASVPTAEGRTFELVDHALEYVRTREDLPVIKAAGLAKGKGVILPDSIDEAVEVVEQMMVQRTFGDAGKTIVVEERLEGTEVSVLAIVDGHNILVLPPCQDHKRLLNNDIGPNTGGMGAFCPSTAIDEKTMAFIEREVLIPTIDALRRDDIEYKGVLYAGIMLTHAGPKVLEYNVRFGDPECQALLALLESDALDLFYAAATGRLHDADVRFSDKHAVCIVMASAGYPDAPTTGVEVYGIDKADAMDGVNVYHAGTIQDGDRILTAGGRILGVTAVGDTIEEARTLAYKACNKIDFVGKHLRTDIGAGITTPA